MPLALVFPLMSDCQRVGLWVLALAASIGSVGAQSRFESWDANHDGKLAKEELPEGLRRNFERVDADHDGFISKEEDAAVPNAGGNRPPGLPEGVRKVADLDYAGTGNPRQALDLFLPEKRASEKPLPVVVYIHGGAWLGGDKGGGAGRLGYLVATGKFAGVSVGYRLSQEAIWPAQIHDCKAAIRWIKAHAAEHNLDPDRIAVCGDSAGGHLVAMLGVSNGLTDLEGTIGSNKNQNSKVKCVVDFYGPTDLLTIGGDHNNAESPESKLIGGAVQDHPDKARNASPLEHVTTGDAPFLIVHGDKDPIVPYSQSVALEKKLKAAGVPVVFITVAGGGHGQGFGRSVHEITAAYLGRQLLGESHDLTAKTVKAGE